MHAGAVPDLILNQAPSSEPDADMVAAMALPLMPDEVPVSGSRNNRPHAYAISDQLLGQKRFEHNALDKSSEDVSDDISSAKDSAEASSDDNSYSGNKSPKRGAHWAEKRNDAKFSRIYNAPTTIWNWTTLCKVNGIRKNTNVPAYLSKHRDCEVYNGQDKLLTPDEILFRSQHQRPQTQKAKQNHFASGSRNPRWRTADLSGRDLPVFTSQKDKTNYLENERKEKSRKRAHSEGNMQGIDVPACLSTADSVVSAISNKLREAKASFLQQPCAKIGAHWAGVRTKGTIRTLEYKQLHYRGESATHKRLTDDNSKQTGRAAKCAPDGSCKVYAYSVLPSPWLTLASS